MQGNFPYQHDENAVGPKDRYKPHHYRCHKQQSGLGPSGVHTISISCLHASILKRRDEPGVNQGDPVTGTSLEARNCNNDLLTVHDLNACSPQTFGM